jgi:hemerythrin-like domain-containing protein
VRYVGCVIKLSQIGTRISESSTVDRPLDHLTACHRRIEDRLETFVRAGEQWTGNPAGAVEAVHNAIRFMDSSGALHTEDEEQSVFPRLRDHIPDEDAAYLARLEAEHEEADRTFAALKELAASLEKALVPEVLDRYRFAAARLRDLYARHIASEDEKLIALGRQALTPDDLAAISDEMKRRRGL